MRGDWEYYYRAYREEVALRGEFQGLQYHGRLGYVFEWDMPRHSSNPYLKREVLARFYALLDHRGRAELNFISDSSAQSGFIKDRDEALTIAALSGECISGNPSGTMRAIYVLSGWRDPIDYDLIPDNLPFPEVLPTMHARAWR